MRVIFIYGQPASGKLTIARELAGRTGMALFHNHLVVDALEAVFPFGSDAFVRLREQFWLAVFAEAAQTDRSLIFTFTPEPTVAAEFPGRVQTLVQSAGGEVVFVALTVPPEEQERRLMRPDRATFSKLRSVDLLRRLRDDLAACTAAMPAPTLTVDTSIVDPGEAVTMIARILSA